MSIVATLASNGALETVMTKAVPLAYAALSHRLLTNRPYGSRSISTLSQPRLMPNQSPRTIKQPYSPISTPSAAFRNTILSRQFSSESIDSIDPNRFGRRRGFNVGIRFVPQQEALVIERFGKFTKILEPGLHFLTPFVEKIAYKHSLKEQMIVMQEHPAVTTDNVSIRVNAVLFVKVVDPFKASYGNDNVMYAVTQLAQTVMRSTIGKMPLDKTFMERENLNSAVVNAINEVATQSGWGVVCCRHEIKDIIPPPGIKESMDKQAEAERKKRAEVIEADGKGQAVVLTSEATKKDSVFQSEAKKTDLILISEAEKIATINRAEGEAKAKRIMAAAEAEAKRIVAAAEADAYGIIAESIQRNGGQEAVILKVAQDYVQAFSKLAQESTTVLLPTALSDPSSMITSALAVYKKVVVDKQHSNNNVQEIPYTRVDSATEIKVEPEALGSPKNIIVDKQDDGNNNLQESSTVVDSATQIKSGALDLEAQCKEEA